MIKYSCSKLGSVGVAWPRSSLFLQTDFKFSMENSVFVFPGFNPPTNVQTF